MKHLIRITFHFMMEFASSETRQSQAIVYPLSQQMSSLQIQPYQTNALLTFLNRFRVQNKLKATHYSMTDPYTGCYDLQNAQNELKLMDYFVLEASKPNPVSIIEKHKEYGPIIIDIDFKYTRHRETRIYTERFVKIILIQYLLSVQLFVDITNIELSHLCYVSEKWAPTVSENGEFYKDGLHFQYPHIITTPIVQKMIRAHFISNEIVIDAFNQLDLLNTIDNAVDEQVILTNGWMFYSSRKNEQSLPYLLHNATYTESICGVYEVSVANMSINNLSLTRAGGYSYFDLIPAKIVRTLSIRLAQIGDVAALTEYGRNEIKTYIAKEHENYIHQLQQYQTRALTKYESGKKDLDYVNKLVQILNSERANDYQSWIRLGWCLHSIHTDLLGTWIDFSKLSTRHSEAECISSCETEWQNITRRNNLVTLGIGTLIRWARMDNPILYKQIEHNSVWKYVLICCQRSVRFSKQIDRGGVVKFKADYSKTFQDIYYYIVKILFHNYSSDYCCSSYDKKVWWQFNGIRWILSEKGLAFLQLLSIEMSTFFLQWSVEFEKQANSDEDPFGKFKKNAYKNICSNLSMKMNNETVRKQILEVASDQFHWANIHDNIVYKTFESILDNDIYLVGLNNGVYDLNEHRFRPTRSDDYVSMSTGNNYIEYTWNDPTIILINQFIEQVLPVVEQRTFVMRLLASFLDGHVLEYIYLCTGVGGNGKSKLFELLQFALGDYTGILPITLLTGKRTQSNGCTPELSRMKGRRLGLLNESNKNDQINWGVVKTICGGDKVYTRGVFSKDAIEFRSTYQLVLLTNAKPKKIDVTDEAIWRRIISIPFFSIFTDTPDPRHLYEFKKDPYLNQKLEKWKEGFFWILTQHYRDYKNHGNPVPKIIEDETKQYKNSNDEIGLFLERFVTVRPGSKVLESQLFRAFKDYCQFECNDKTQMKLNEFADYMKKKYGNYNLPNHEKGWIDHLYMDNTPMHIDTGNSSSSSNAVHNDMHNQFIHLDVEE